MQDVDITSNTRGLEFVFVTKDRLRTTRTAWGMCVSISNTDTGQVSQHTNSFLGNGSLSRLSPCGQVRLKQKRAETLRLLLHPRLGALTSHSQTFQSLAKACAVGLTVIADERLIQNVKQKGCVLLGAARQNPRKGRPTIDHAEKNQSIQSIYHV